MEVSQERVSERRGRLNFGSSDKAQVFIEDLDAGSRIALVEAGDQHMPEVDRQTAGRELTGLEFHCLKLPPLDA